MISLRGWHGTACVLAERYAADPTEAPKKGRGQALSHSDLVVLWGLLRAENLVEVFFHDGSVRDLPGFVRYATDPANWFYAAQHNGLFIGMGVVNNFTSGGNTAHAHLVSFKAGRERPHNPNHSAQAGDQAATDTPDACPFAQAGRIWFDLLHRKGGLHTLIAVIPACYRGVRAWAESFGFVPRMRLPGALMLTRAQGKTRRSDACVYQLQLGNKGMDCDAGCARMQ